MIKRESTTWVLMGALWVGFHLVASHVLLPHLNLREIHPFSTWRIYSQSYPDKVDFQLRANHCSTQCSVPEGKNLISEMKGDYRRHYWQIQTLGTAIEANRGDWAVIGLRRLLETTLPQSKGCCFRLFKRKIDLQTYYFHGKEESLREVMGSDIAL